MSLKADFDAAMEEPKPKFEQWVADLPDTDRAAIIAAAASPRLSHRAFHDVVKKNGARVAKETLTNWRKANGYVAR